MSDRHWAQSEEEIRSLDPEGTTHPWISKDKTGFYWFWDEIQTSMFGPYATLTDAHDGLMNYGKELDELHNSLL
jgi:hypothetical protein